MIMTQDEHKKQSASKETPSQSSHIKDAYREHRQAVRDRKYPFVNDEAARQRRARRIAELEESVKESFADHKNFSEDKNSPSKSKSKLRVGEKIDPSYQKKQANLSTNTFQKANRIDQPNKKVDQSKTSTEENTQSQTEDQPSKVKSLFFPWFSKKTENQSTHPVQESPYSIRGLSLADQLSIIVSVMLNVFRRLLVNIFVVLVLLGVFASGIGAGYFTSLVSNTEPPSKQEMAEAINQIEQQSSLYYDSGELIADIRSDVVRSVANLDEISPFIIDGLIAIEDQSFYSHLGVNPKSTFRAILQTLLTGTGTGGSTLTQQLVKQQLLNNEVTFFRKANEILLALRLEKYFSKDEILNAYLNVSPFGRNNMGDNIAGIREAAEGIFGKEPSEVNLPQAAFLVGLPQDPYTYTPYTQNSQLRDNFEPGIKRMQSVLFSMYRNKAITKEDYDSAIKYDITKDFIEPKNRPVERQTYLYQAVLNEAILKIMDLNIQDDGYQLQEVSQDSEWYNKYYFEAENQLRTGGYQVYSTIDKEIYQNLQEAAATYDDQLGRSYEGVYTDPSTGEEIYFVEKVQTGVVVIENQSGKVLGFVAGTDYENNQIDHAFATRRSPGSTIKPLAVYAPAIENNLIAPASIIPDTKFVETYADGTEWAPTNYGESISNKFLTARESLAKSLNLPTIRIYQGMLQQNVPVYDYLQKMGFPNQSAYSEEETHNLAFSLGGVHTGPTVFEQTSAFSTFANNGNYIQGHLISKIEDSFGNIVFEQEIKAQKVFSEDTNYLMIDILRDTTDFGSGMTAKEYLRAPGDWIAKSGTSENAKDLWFIASTPAITVGAWAGYDSQYYEYLFDPNDGFGNESVRNQIFWAQIVNSLYDIRPEIFGSDLVFQQPASVISQSILALTGTLPGTINYNGRTATLTGPLKEDLFKVSHPAGPLSYEFMFNASKEDTAIFWNHYLNSLQTTRSESEESEESTDTSENDESTLDGESTTDPGLTSNEFEPIESPEYNVE